MNDVTVSKHLELADLGDEIHLRYDALFHNTLEGVLIYNYIKEEIVDCNKAAGTVLGYDNERVLIGRTRKEIIPQFDPIYPDVDLHEMSDENGRRAINGESFSTKGIIIGHLGERYLVRSMVVPTFYMPGEAFIIFKDVTEEVLSKKALKASETRYKDIYENSHEGIIYIDPKSFDIIMCNNRALEMCAAKNIQELREIDPSCFYLDDGSVPSNSRQMYLDIVQGAVKQGRFSFSIWFNNLRGELSQIEGVVVSDNSQSKSPKLIAFVRDVTELYKSQLAIQKKNEQLNAYIDSNLQLENFAYLASHDLQTPLRSIICFSQLLERKIDAKLTPSDKELFRFIKNSGKRMGEIIDQLLLYSKVEKDPLVRTKIDINDLVNQLKTEMASDIQSRGASIEFTSTCKNIIADRHKFTQVLRNLYSNSLKFAQDNVKTKIQVTCEEKPLHWLFCVNDNGIGIDQQYHDTIFIMFKKLHVKEEFGGSGFGLSMVKKIIELHKGSIWVESHIGHGTSIYFTLAKKI